MAYKIIQTKLFLQQVVELNTYLEVHWSHKVASLFHAKLIRIIQIISTHPSAGSVSKHSKKARKILVTKHNRIYYRINTDDSITLLTLFDTRQNPRTNLYD